MWRIGLCWVGPYQAVPFWAKKWVYDRPEERKLSGWGNLDIYSGYSSPFTLETLGVDKGKLTGCLGLLWGAFGTTWPKHVRNHNQAIQKRFQHVHWLHMLLGFEIRPCICLLSYIYCVIVTLCELMEFESLSLSLFSLSNLLISFTNNLNRYYTLTKSKVIIYNVELV